MSEKIVRVAILDDHQSMIDGYIHRLRRTPEIEIVVTANYGEELEHMLGQLPVDVLLLDLSVPTSPDNPSPFPVLHVIPKLLQKYSNLSILVISMFSEVGLMRSLIETGVSGYILKSDQTAFSNLADILLSVARGQFYFSERANQLYRSLSDLQAGDLLTPRQMQVISLCAAYPDVTTMELAQMMAVSKSTIRNLLSSVYLRLGVHSRKTAVKRAQEMGLIIPRPPALEI